MAVYMTDTCWFVLVDTNLAIYRLISSKFHILITFIKSNSGLNIEFCLMNDNYDGHQNGRLCSVGTC